MDGLCEDIPLRVHRTPSIADRGAFRAQRDWQHLFGSLPDTSTSYAGIMGPEHNFVATCMPEALPDRLELVAYVTEIVFLMDDMIDSADSGAAVASRYLGDFLQAYNAVMAGGEVEGGSGSPVVKILVDVARAMLEVDAEGAKAALAWLRKWSALMLSTPDAGKECRDLDEYLKYRRVNIASEYVHISVECLSQVSPGVRYGWLTALTGPRSVCSCLPWD
jgi:fusicocca-2,10(14)-diene synthase/ophiobolin F synthase